jgi:hypothetical protein
VCRGRIFGYHQYRPRGTRGLTWALGSGVMKQEEWLKNYIASCFSDVTLGGGTDIYAAQSSADYGNFDEDILSQSAERGDWQSVPHRELIQRFDGVTFLDAIGFCFYTPVIMTLTIEENADADGRLFEHFLSDLHVTPAGMIKGVHFNTLFTSRHRAAIIRFLKYLVYNRDCGIDSLVGRRPKEIQTRTSPK